MGYGTVRVTTAATKIVSGNTNRQSLILTNTSSSGICYLGPDSSITSANAAAYLRPYGVFMEDSGSTRVFQGDVYGRTLSAHAAVKMCYWERTV